MKVHKQELHLELEGNMLSVFRVSKDGKRRKCSTRDKGESLTNVLDALILKKLRYRLRTLGDSRLAIRNTILAGLCDAAKSCGCEPRFRRGGHVVTFYLKSQPLVAIDVQGDWDKYGYSTSAEYENSKALFRRVVLTYRDLLFVKDIRKR